MFQTLKQAPHITVDKKMFYVKFIIRNMIITASLTQEARHLIPKMLCKKLGLKTFKPPNISSLE